MFLYGLAGQPRRHGELARLIGEISSKVLTHTLRRLENGDAILDAREAFG